jgi:hypothetical protein
LLNQGTLITHQLSINHFKQSDGKVVCQGGSCAKPKC